MMTLDMNVLSASVADEGIGNLDVPLGNVSE